MYPLSEAASAELGRSHRIVTRCEVSDAGGAPVVLRVVDGKVAVDGSAAVRRRCDLTLVDPTGELTPDTAEDLLAPFGGELRLWRGVRLPNGTDELVPLGVFGISDVDVEDRRGGLQLHVEAYDRARKVRRNRWAEPMVVLAGSNYGQAIADVVDSRLPGLTYRFSPTSRTTPQILLGESSDNDPWADAAEMAAAIGMELFFDPTGVCVLRPVPDPASDPTAWTYSEDQVVLGAGPLLGLSRRLSDEHTYNHVIVAGESTSIAAPVRAEAVDDDPTSPTWIGDPWGSSDYGDVPYFQVSSLITSAAQAAEAAAARLRRTLGAVEDVRFSGLVNPAHEAGDVVAIRRARAGVDARYVLESFAVPLRARVAMDATTRRRGSAS